MTEQLPKTFDPVLLAEQAAYITGSLSVAAMQRLQPNLTMSTGEIKVELGFQKTSQGKPLLTGQIKGMLMQRCERCLQNIETPVDHQFTIVLLAAEHADAYVSEGYEYQEYSGQNIALTEFIEDELLLILPIVAKHSDIKLCDTDMLHWLDKQSDKGIKKESPFAVLKSINERSN